MEGVPGDKECRKYKIQKKPTTNRLELRNDLASIGFALECGFRISGKRYDK